MKGQQMHELDMRRGARRGSIVRWVIKLLAIVAMVVTLIDTYATTPEWAGAVVFTVVATVVIWIVE